MTTTLKIDLIGAFDESERELALAATRRLLEVLRAEFPMVTVVYPPEAAGKGRANQWLGHYINKLKCQ